MVEEKQPEPDLTKCPECGHVWTVTDADRVQVPIGPVNKGYGAPKITKEVIRCPKCEWTGKISHGS